MAVSNLIEGVLIGSIGGAAAGIAVYFIQYLHHKIADKRDSEKLYHWLLEHTSQDRNTFVSTKVLSSWNNMTEERVRHLCSLHSKIFLCVTDQSENHWSLYKRQAEPNVRFL